MVHVEINNVIIVRVGHLHRTKIINDIRSKDCINVKMILFGALGF